MLLSERHTIAGTGLQPGEGHTEGDAVSAPTLAVVHAHRLVWSVLWRRTPTVVPLGAQSKGTRQVISYDTASTDGIDPLSVMILHRLMVLITLSVMILHRLMVLIRLTDKPHCV